MDNSQSLTVKEFARRKGCTLKYVYDLLAVGRLRGARKVDRVWRIPVGAAGTKTTAGPPRGARVGAGGERLLKRKRG